MSESARPEASVIIVTYNGAAWLEKCLAALRRSEPFPFEVIVVDNGSSDGSAELAKRLWPGALIIKNGMNLGFGSGNNVGIRAAKGEFFLLLNQDTEVPAGWVGAIVAGMKRDQRIGALGCKLVYPDGKIQHAGGVLYANGLPAHQGAGDEDRGQWDEAGPRTYVTAAAIGLRRSALETVGLFDPGFDPAYFEEVDLQLRMWKGGWKVWYEAGAGVVHHESQVLGAGERKWTVLLTKHRLRFVGLHGLPGPRGEAWREEKKWWGDMKRKGKLGPAVQSYLWALVRWPLWKLERSSRKSVPRLRKETGN